MKQICLHPGGENLGNGIESKFGATDMHNRRGEDHRRGLLSAIGRLSSREGLSTPRGVYPEVFEGRSGRDDGKVAICDSTKGNRRLTAPRAVGSPRPEPCSTRESGAPTCAPARR